MSSTDFGEIDWEANGKTDKLIEGLFGEIHIKAKKKKRKGESNEEAISSKKRKMFTRTVPEGNQQVDKPQKYKKKDSYADGEVHPTALDDIVSSERKVEKNKKGKHAPNKTDYKDKPVDSGKKKSVDTVVNKKKNTRNKYKHLASNNNIEVLGGPHKSSTNEENRIHGKTKVSNKTTKQSGKADFPRNEDRAKKTMLTDESEIKYRNENITGKKRKPITEKDVSVQETRDSIIKKDEFLKSSPVGLNNSSKNKISKRKSKEMIKVGNIEGDNKRNTSASSTVSKKSKNKYQHLAKIAREQSEGNTTNTDKSPVQLPMKKKHRRAKKKKHADEKHTIDPNTTPSKSIKPQSKSSSKVKSPFDIPKLKALFEEPSKTVQGVSPTKPEKSAKKAPEKQNLKERMQQQLKSARFRYLNEQLYTISGSQAYNMFQEDEEAFQVYHNGFQNQVTKWPENPLDKMVEYIRKRPKTEVVADFGCGDAQLAVRLPHKVHSFDLIAVNSKVTACDMAKVPLTSGSVDIGVFCLSLMGTNLVEYLTEAHRLLKHSGTLLIAEVVSRFEKVGAFVRKMQKLGYMLVEKDTSNKMFVWFEFQKAADYDKDMLPHIDLQPCVYKKR